MRYAVVEGEQLQSSSELGFDATSVLDTLPTPTLVYDTSHQPPKLVYANDLAMQAIERDAPTSELRRIEVMQVTDYVKDRLDRDDIEGKQRVRGYNVSMRKLAGTKKPFLAVFLEPLVRRLSSVSVRIRTKTPSLVFTRPTVRAMELRPTVRAVDIPLAVPVRAVAR